jgi:arylformamidase
MDLHLSDAERERAYSPSSCIGGNYRPFIEAYARQSAAARARALALGARWLEVRYGSRPAQRMDLCLPRGAAAAGTGLLVFIHGGYWQELSARDSLFAAAQCVERGMAFCAVDYTLAPAATVGGIVAECRRALQMLAANAASWGLAAKRIVVAGSSAGAHLAAMCCLPAWYDAGGVQARAFRPHAAVPLSGLYALEPLVGTSINDALGLYRPQARAQSPALQALQGFPSALLCWGEVETDAFKAQSRDFAAALQAAGGSCVTMEVGARNHFDLALDLADPATTLGRHTLGLLDAA